VVCRLSERLDLSVCALGNFHSIDRGIFRIRQVIGIALSKNRRIPGLSAPRADGMRVALRYEARRVRMVTRDRVEAVLNRVRPFMQADGGDIELVNVDGNCADVRLTGVCAGCPSAHMTLYLGIETVLRDDIPEFESLRLV
jgi:Fe-S cluster biogenesis protein NfuA